MSALACLAVGALSCGSAQAGTVTFTITDDGTHSPNGGCTNALVSSPWQFLVQAGGSACEWRLPINAVPGSRAGDIVSAHAVVRLKALGSGFRVGLRASSGGTAAGSVPVPSGDHIVTTTDSTGPFQVSSGTLTLELQSDGTGAVDVATATARKLVVRVTDTRPPRVLGSTAAIPADIAIGRPLVLGARLTDNGPDTTGLRAAIHWGDGTSSPTVTPRPPMPFTTASMVTGLAQHAYAVPGAYTVSVDVRDTAGNLGHETLGRIRAWGPPINIRPPRVRGVMAVGSLLTCSTGGWLETGGPSPYSFQWIRGRALIPGQTVGAYQLTAADRGRAIACRVTGRNPVGLTRTALSAARRLWVAPVVVRRPSIHGRRRAGSRLTCVAGSWRGPPQRIRISWVRNGRQLHSHMRRLRLTRVDRGARIRCRVTASNPAGRKTVSSRTIHVRR